MALTVNTNIASINAQRQLTSSNLRLERATERLSSGKFINSASDDAAGLSISNRMTSQVRGLNQAIRNANDGISLIQVAEGALSESTNALQRIRELALQSANGVYSDADRSTLDAEVQQLVSELDRIAESTTFNGESILNAKRTIDLQVGNTAGETISLGLEKVDTQSLGMASTSADVTGYDMALSTSGKLSSAIKDNAILINGQSLGPLDTTNTLDDVLNKINDDINGVSAEAVSVIESTTAGTGVLGSNQNVTVQAYTATGERLSFAITGTESLDELAEAINDNGAGKIRASIDDGKLVVTGDNIASLSIVDSTSGIATGINQGVAGGTEEEKAVVNALQNYWVSEGENLITTYFGLSGGGETMDLNLYTDSGSSTVASVSYTPNGVTNFGEDLSLNINMHYFSSGTMPNGGSAPFYTDRVIAHEMVHAVMTVQMDMSAMPGWFTEGVAEFIHGADERVVGDIYTSGSVDAAKVSALTLKTTAGSPSDSAGYSAGYLAVRMLHDNIVAETGNTAAFQTLMTTLSGQGSATDLDAAISSFGINWGSGTGLAAFEAHFNSQKSAYINGTYTGPGNSGTTTSSLDLTNADTGSIAGFDVNSSNSVLTAESVLPNTATAGPVNFTLDIPEALSGGATSATARLLLSADYDDPITITRGATGSLKDLQNIGFRESDNAGEIEGVGLTNPETAWSSGDITINGVAIDPTDTNSLQGKLDAINKATADTGVRAESFASGVIDLSNFDFTQWATISGAPDFKLNGATLTGIMAATDIEGIKDVFNNASDETGITAKVSGTRLILEGNRAITFSNPSAASPTADAFGASNYGKAKFLSAADDIAGSTATTFTSGTLANAGIKLISDNGSAIALTLDNPPAGTTGWLNTTLGNSQAFGSAIANISVATVEGAQKALKSVDNALESINATRSNLGAVTNRLSFVVSNLSNVVENTSAARSRIMDSDFAKETAELSRAQVMQQAASAMLAQANARPQQVLSLLQ